MLQELKNLLGDDRKAEIALDVINCDDYQWLLDTFPVARHRVAECYHKPSINDVKLRVLNAILEGYGIEAFQIYEGYNESDYCSYVNMGDTYALTVCFLDGEFVVSSCGDIAEKHTINNNE